MKSNRVVFALSAALIASLAVTACKKNEEVAATAPAPATVAAASTTPATAAPVVVPDNTFTIGTSEAADKSVAAAAAFTPKDKFVVSVKTNASTPANAVVEAKLSYVKTDGSTISAGNAQSATIAAAGEGTTNITFANSKPWPTGTYKVDVTLNGSPVGSTQSIEVK